MRPKTEPARLRAPDPVTPNRTLPPLRLVVDQATGSAARASGRRHPVLAGTCLGGVAAGLLWLGADIVSLARLLGAMAAAVSIGTLALAAVVPGRAAVAAAATGAAGFLLALASLVAGPWLAAAAVGGCALWGLAHVRTAQGEVARLWCAWTLPLAAVAAAQLSLL